MAAQREVKEELGLEIDTDNLKLIYQYKKAQHFVDVFYIELDVELEMLKLKCDEVKDVKFASLLGIRRMVTDKKFYSYIYLPILEIKILQCVKSNIKKIESV